VVLALPDSNAAGLVELYDTAMGGVWYGREQLSDVLSICPEFALTIGESIFSCFNHSVPGDDPVSMRPNCFGGC
jgi:hypothetical protein